MDLHIFQRNSREKVRGRVERGRERTVTERDRDRETVQTETASLAAGMRASKSCSFPSWGVFFFFPPGSFLFSFVFTLPPLVALQKITRASCFSADFQTGEHSRLAALAEAAESSPGRGGQSTQTTCSFSKRPASRKSLLLSLITKERRVLGMSATSLWGCSQRGFLGVSGEGMDSFGDRPVGEKMIQVQGDLCPSWLICTPSKPSLCLCSHCNLHQVPILQELG